MAFWKSNPEEHHKHPELWSRINRADSRTSIELTNHCQASKHFGSPPTPMVPGLWAPTALLCLRAGGPPPGAEKPALPPCCGVVLPRLRGPLSGLPPSTLDLNGELSDLPRILPQPSVPPPPSSPQPRLSSRARPGAAHRSGEV